MDLGRKWDKKKLERKSKGWKTSNLMKNKGKLRIKGSEKKKEKKWIYVCKCFNYIVHNIHTWSVPIGWVINEK